MTTQYAGRRAARLAGPSYRPGRAPLLVLLAGTFVTFLDFFIVNVALPSLSRSLHASPAAVQFVVASFALAFAVCLISGGRLGDRFGRRRIFAVGLAGFTVASAACGLAPSAAVLIGARAAQGVAAALMTPQVLATIAAVYTGPRQARAFAAYGFTMGIAGVLGQLIGGALIAADLAGAGWRSIFLINVPVGVAALAFVRLVPESRGQRVPLDLAGTALITCALTALVLPLVEGRQQGWPGWTWLCLAAAPLLFAGFGLHQRGRSRRERLPLVPLSLLRDRSFGIGIGIGVSFGGVPAAFFFVLALYLQEGRGLSPLLSGVVFSAVGAGYFASVFMAGRLAARLGRQVLAAGAATVAAGCLLLAVTARAAGTVSLVPGLALVGGGIGLVLVPLAAMVLSGIATADAGAASGVLSTGQQVGGALGVAVIGVVFFGALGGAGFPHAFATSLVWLAVITGAAAVLAQFLPRPRAR